MLRRIAKWVIFLALVASIFMALHKTISLQQTVKTAQQVNLPQLKEDFLQAIQKEDLANAKLYYTNLKKHLPEHDDFMQTVAPAYLADLYIQYAKRMHFNQDAQSLLLKEARFLAPEHPYLVKGVDLWQAPLIVEAQQPLPLPDYDAKIATLEDDIHVLEYLLEEEEIRFETELTQAVEKAQLLLAEQLAAEQALVPEPEPEPEVALPAKLALPEIPETNDVCALAFYTRDSPLGACVDKIAQDYFGPSLFVIADKQETPVFAFTQAPVTYYDYELFCQLSGQCYEETTAIDLMVSELQLSGIELDLSEVHQTVADYNRYCQMTRLCKTIETPNPSERVLSKGEMQRYALWLTKETGNRYRLLNDADTMAIYQYFQECMQNGECSASMLEQLAIVFKDKNLILVREL